MFARRLALSLLCCAFAASRSLQRKGTPTPLNLRRSNQSPTGLVPPLVKFALPFLIYTIAKSSLGEVHALLIASSPPIAWTIIGFARTRRIDALLAVVVGVDALTPILNKANK
jgi:hypothetical protein